MIVAGVLVFGFIDVSSAAVKKAAPKKKAAPVRVVAPAAAVESAATAKGGLFVEGGLAGGGGAVEVGYGRSLNDKVYMSGAAGYAVGSGYGVVVLDPVRLSYDLGALSVGAGLSYAMYSNIITGVPGISGNIPSKNMVGVEVMAAKQFSDKMTGQLAFDTALGLRASLGYLF